MSTAIYAGCAVLATFAVILHLVRKFLYKPLYLARCLKRQNIPGCVFRPIVGQIPEIQKMARGARADSSIEPSPFPFLDAMAAKFGDVFYYYLGPVPRLVITDPVLIRSLLVQNDKSYEKTALAKAFTLLGKGLLLASGESWAEQRNLVHPAFYPAEVKRMYSHMVDCTEAAMADLSAKAKVSAEVDAAAEMESLTLTVIAKCAFGADTTDVGASVEVFETYYKNILQFTRGQGLVPGYRHFPSRLTRKIVRQEAVVRKWMLSVIQKRRDGLVSKNESGPADFLSLLLSSHKSSDGAGNEKEGAQKNNPVTVLSDQLLMDECCTFLVAGHETTSSLLTWTMLLLSQNPEWQQKAREEVVDVCGSDSLPLYEKINSLKCITMILNESMRLFPPGPCVGRFCIQTNVIGTIKIPPGVDVLVPVSLLHRKKELWGDDAHLFNPQRFEDGINNAGSHPLAFAPFGVGPRTCIGQNFAQTEAKLILASLLQKFSWSVAPGYKHCPEETVTLKPKYGLPLILKAVETSKE